jgi:hypothetical protein
MAVEEKHGRLEIFEEKELFLGEDVSVGKQCVYSKSSGILSITKPAAT